jgi:hypothetical protein
MTRRELAAAAALSVLVGALYLGQKPIGPLLSTAAIVLIVGQVLISVVEDVFPREQRQKREDAD